MPAQPHPHFEKPPLVEAVFELFAQPRAEPSNGGGSVDTVFHQLPTYAHHPQVVGQFQVQIPVIAGPPPSARLVNPAKRQWTEDRTRGALVGPGMLALNMLPPYTTFDDEAPRLRELLVAYLDVFRPIAPFSLGHRYINRVVLDVPNDDPPSALFTLYPRLPESGVAHRPVTVQVEAARFHNGVVVANLALAAVDTSHAAYVLDIYARTTDPAPDVVDEILAWHREAHEQVVNAFLFAITPRARERFEEKYP